MNFEFFFQVVWVEEKSYVLFLILEIKTSIKASRKT